MGPMLSKVFRRFVLVVLAALLIPAGLVHAQGKKKGDEGAGRSVQGVITDAAGNSVAGAVVQLKNTKTLQIRSFLTNDQGQYYFNGLSSDVDYELHAEYNGAKSATKTLSAFDARKQAVLNLKLDK